MISYEMIRHILLQNAKSLNSKSHILKISWNFEIELCGSGIQILMNVGICLFLQVILFCF